jgi:hypothetical protein
MLFSIVLPWLAAAMLLLHSSLATAIPTPGELLRRDNGTYENVAPFPFDTAHTPYLASAFDVILSIPDSVIAQGDAAVKQWIKDHTPTQPPPTRDLHPDLEPRVGWWGVANCVATIFKVLTKDEFEVVRILRIRQLINDLGGTWAVAKMLLSAKKWADLIKLAGQELVDLANILVSSHDIMSGCFHIL